MRRLVVGHVLPGNGFPVLTVMHERVKPIGGGNSGSEDHKLGIVTIAPDDLLSPVAEKIR